MRMSAGQGRGLTARPRSRDRLVCLVRVVLASRSFRLTKFQLVQSRKLTVCCQCYVTVCLLTISPRKPQPHQLNKNVSQHSTELDQSVVDISAITASESLTSASQTPGIAVPGMVLQNRFNFHPQNLMNVYKFGHPQIPDWNGCGLSRHPGCHVPPQRSVSPASTLGAEKLFEHSPGPSTVPWVAPVTARDQPAVASVHLEVSI